MVTISSLHSGNTSRGGCPQPLPPGAVAMEAVKVDCSQITLSCYLNKRKVVVELVGEEKLRKAIF